MMRINADEMRARLYDALELGGRAITFTIFDTDAGTFFEPGIVETSDDLVERDWPYDVGEARTEDMTLTLYGAESWMIGDGEADHADISDCDYLADLYETSRNALDACLRDYGDLLTTLNGCEVDNPWYENDDA